MIRAALRDKFKIDFNPIYVKTHSSVYLNVILNQAAAGGGVQKTLKQQRPIIQSKLKVLYETEKIVPHPLAAHPRVPKKIRDLITTAFLKLGQSQRGIKLLARIPIRKIGKASLNDYKPLAKMALARFTSP